MEVFFSSVRTVKHMTLAFTFVLASGEKLTSKSNCSKTYTVFAKRPADTDNKQAQDPRSECGNCWTWF